MKFKLSIDTGNAAFDDGVLQAELARILRQLADEIARVETGNLHGIPLNDINGNWVGMTAYKRR